MPESRSWKRSKNARKSGTKEMEAHLRFGDKVEPKIRRDVVEDCQEDLDDVDEQDEVLRILAEWRRNENREWEFNRNSSTVENERNNIKTAEIRIWKEELMELIPESEFKTCGLCESLQMPKATGARVEGYVWECPDCF